jgi:hypothetical protein
MKKCMKKYTTNYILNIIFNILQMNHYRACMLILASNNNNVYKNCRKVWKAYMNIDPTIKVFFVYGRLEEPLSDYDKDTDLVFDQIEESLYIKKTIEAMKVIHSRITYDFFIRTNLSTFWDFKKLHLHLNELPISNCYSGDGPLPGYIYSGYYLSGTDTIVTPEMITSIISNTHLVDFNLIEDAAMGKYFNGVMGAPMLPNRICFFEDICSINEVDKIDKRINNAIDNNRDHYRVKSIVNREQNDLFIYIRLLNIIYNIKII